METEFAGKSVLVTGAARGLGRAVAEAFLGQGAQVLLVDIDAPRLEAALGEIVAPEGRARSFVADTSNRDQCFAAVAAAVDAFGKLDVLASVAGVLGVNHFADFSARDVERILLVNVAGPFYLAQAAIPHLLETHGNIVNVASASAWQGCAYIVPYSASKAALVQMTKSLAMEYMKAPIRINAVSPGPMPTEISAGQTWRDDFDPQLTSRFSGIRSKDHAVAEVTDTILYVASERARALHGANVAADHGAAAG